MQIWTVSLYIAYVFFLKLSFFSSLSTDAHMLDVWRRNPKAPCCLCAQPIVQSACYQWSQALLKYFIRSLHYMLTLLSFYCLIVHFHSDLVSNLDRLEMCNLLADIWFQKCFVLKVPLCCAQMTELWVVKGFFLLVFWLSNAEVISYLQRLSCPLMPPTWDKSHAGARQRIGLNLKAGFRCSSRRVLSQLGEECPVMGKSLHRLFCIPWWGRALLCRGALCPPLS